MRTRQSRHHITTKIQRYTADTRASPTNELDQTQLTNSIVEMACIDVKCHFIAYHSSSYRITILYSHIFISVTTLAEMHELLLSNNEQDCFEVIIVAFAAVLPPLNRASLALTHGMRPTRDRPRL